MPKNARYRSRTHMPPICEPISKIVTSVRPGRYLAAQIPHAPAPITAIRFGFEHVAIMAFEAVAASFIRALCSATDGRSKVIPCGQAAHRGLVVEGRSLAF